MAKNSKLTSNLFCSLIRLYQLAISPFLKPRCRFHPCCSHYAIEAFEKHGVMKGLFLSCKRLLKCQPFSKHWGLDPVPGTNHRDVKDG